MATMTPLDLIIAVTFGSAFGRVVTATDVGLARVVVALVLLYYDDFQSKALHRHRLTEADIHSAVRQARSV